MKFIAPLFVTLLLAGCSTWEEVKQDLTELVGEDCKTELEDALDSCKDTLSQQNVGDLIDMAGEATMQQTITE